MSALLLCTFCQTPLDGVRCRGCGGPYGLHLAVVRALAENGFQSLSDLAEHFRISEARVEVILAEVEAAGIKLLRQDKPARVELDEAAQPEVLVPEPAPVVGLDICAACAGEGRVFEPEWDYSPATGYVPGERDCGRCEACDGTGRELIDGETAGEPEPVIMDLRGLAGGWPANPVIPATSIAGLGSPRWVPGQRRALFLSRKRQLPSPANLAALGVFRASEMEAVRAR